MTGAISNFGMSPIGFLTRAAPIFGLASLAKTVSAFAVPTISMYVLSNLPVAEAKHAKGGKDDDVYVQCVAACDKNGKDAHEFAKLLCYGICLAIDVFKNKK